MVDFSAAGSRREFDGNIVSECQSRTLPALLVRNLRRRPSKRGDQGQRKAVGIMVSRPIAAKSTARSLETGYHGS